MSDEEDDAPKKEEGGGAPGWIVTFSDLMSLLLAFFVLLFAFSSIDDKKFKKMGGSLSEAFGVQRQVVLTDPVMGINHIATEFSAARPDNKTLNVVPQDQLLLVLRYLTSEPPVNAEKESGLGPTETKDDVHGLKKVDVESKQTQAFEDKGKSPNESIDDLKSTVTVKEKLKDEKDEDKDEQEMSKDLSRFDQAKFDNADAKKNDENLAPNFEKEKSMAEEEKEQPEDARNEIQRKFPKQGDLDRAQLIKLKKGANELREKLKDEIEQGFIEVEVDNDKLIIRMIENGSFPPGQAKVMPEAMPIVKNISETLKEIEGKIMVSGHTDNIPTSGEKFKSNFELSTQRAVEMVHALNSVADLKQERISIEGHGENKPIESNDTIAGRARNRRVEIVVKQEAPEVKKFLSKGREQRINKKNHVKNEKMKLDSQLKEIFTEAPNIFE